MNRIPVAVLGATGPVGQRAITMLANHPKFRVGELAASDARAGKRYREVVQWKNELPCPEEIGEMEMRPMTELQAPLVISALPADVALEIEPLLAGRGQLVSSNASAFRMVPNVPLLVPELNSAHLELLNRQQTKGKLLTNPNCSTVFLVAALAPLMELGEIEHVSAVTLQALSGAGYPGVPSFDLLGNVIPHIGGEEAKIQEESRRILGGLDQPAPFALTVHVHRVPVLHGHTVAAHVTFKTDVPVEAVQASFARWEKRHPDLFRIHEAPDRPQPLRDLSPHEMKVQIGRIKQGGTRNRIGLIALGHNLVRGAAGAAIANLEAATQFLGGWL